MYVLINSTTCWSQTPVTILDYSLSLTPHRVSQVVLMINNLLANEGDVKDMDSGFNPWIGKIPWRRAWQPTPVFLPGESYGQRSLAGNSPWGHKDLDMTEAIEHACTSLLNQLPTPDVFTSHISLKSITFLPTTVKSSSLEYRIASHLISHYSHPELFSIYLPMIFSKSNLIPLFSYNFLILNLHTVLQRLSGKLKDHSMAKRQEMSPHTHYHQSHIMALSTGLSVSPSWGPVSCFSPCLAPSPCFFSQINS